MKTPYPHPIPYDDAPPTMVGYERFSCSEDIFWTKLDTWTEKQTDVHSYSNTPLYFCWGGGGEGYN